MDGCMHAIIACLLDPMNPSHDAHCMPSGMHIMTQKSSNTNNNNLCRHVMMPAFNNLIEHNGLLNIISVWTDV